MRIRSMIRLDEWLGIPLAWLAAAGLAAARRFGHRRRPPASPRRILVTKYFGMGSLVLALPALDELRRHHPRAAIHLLTFASNGPLAARLDPVDRVHLVRTDRLGRFLADTLRVVVRLRRLRFDTSIDLEFFSRYAALVPLAGGVRWRVGFGPGPRSRAAILDAALPFDRGRHLEESYRDLVMHLPGEGDPSPASGNPRRRESRITMLPEDSLRLEAILEAHGVSPRAPLLVVNPNASPLCLERRWPLPSFAALVERIAPRIPAHHVVFIGSRGERGHVGALAAALSPAARSRTVDLCGALELGALLALLARARGLVTNDSGPMHLAASLGTPVLALFGPESPVLYGPRNPARGSAVFYRPVPCSPCLNVYRGKISACGGDNACMQGIGVEEVARATLRLLARASSRPSPPRATPRRVRRRRARRPPARSVPLPGGAP